MTTQPCLATLALHGISCPGAAVARVNPLTESLAVYPIVQLNQIRDRVLASGEPLFDFSMGDPPDPTPPFIRQALLDAVPEISQYPTVTGTAPVRAAFCSYIKRRFNVDLHPERHVLPSSGSKEVVFHLPMMVLDPKAPDRGVIYSDPCYPVYERGTRFAGGQPHAVPLHGDFRFRPWELPRDVLKNARLMFINTPHNPTSAVSSLEDLRRTWETCREHDILLVSDDTYADMYDDEPPPNIFDVSTEGVLSIHSLSKRSAMTGFRSGFIAGDEAWIQRLRLFRPNPGLASQSFINEAARVAWLDDAHVRERRSRFKERRALIMDFFQEVGIEAVQSGATIYIWFKAPQPFDDLSYHQHLLKEGILATPGRMLATTEAGNGYLRLALVPDIEGCAKAIEAWRRLL